MENPAAKGALGLLLQVEILSSLMALCYFDFLECVKEHISVWELSCSNKQTGNDP